jgi:hypothetical protein
MDGNRSSCSIDMYTLILFLAALTIREGENKKLKLSSSEISFQQSF